MLVSVIVPVYNAGDYLDRCAPSLLNQSLPPDQYEVIYVNDGSTDDSEDRLRRITAQYPHARFISQPNSGWPGKPRNVGIEASEAEYVQFVDQDDELAPEALERLYALASRSAADIVLGKMGGSMAKPIPVFARTVEGASLADLDAIDSLTGHKMFRRAFLDQHQIRFPEGYWRMEDLLFVVRAYAHDPRLSVLGDYVCYWWHAREDGGNHSLAAFDLAEDYGRLRVIIKTLRDSLEPGPLADTLLRRLYRIETMSLVAEQGVAADPDGSWRTALPLLASVARECFPAGVRDGLPPVRRLRSLLAEAEDHEGLHTLSTRTVRLVPTIRRRRIGLDDEGVLHASLWFTLSWPAGPDGAPSQPLTIVPEGSHLVLDPALTAGLGEFATFPVGDPLVGAHGILRLEDPDRSVWWYPETDLVPAVQQIDELRQQVVVAGDVQIDPATAAAGHPLPPGVYTIWFFGEVLGVGRRRRLVMPQAARANPSRWHILSRAPTAVQLDWSGQGAKLRLVVRDRQEWLAEELRTVEPAAPPDPSDLAVRCRARLPKDPVEVTLSIADRPLVAQVVRGAAPDTALLRLPAGSDLPSGRHTAVVAGAFDFLAGVESTGGTLRWADDSSLAGLLTDPPPRQPGLRRLFQRWIG